MKNDYGQMPHFRMTTVNQQPQESRAFALTTLLLSLVSLVMQCVGLATNGWWIAYTASFRNGVRISLAEINVGLWTVKYCFDDSCGELSNEEFWDEYSAFEYAVIKDVTEFRVETCLGASFMFVVFVLAIVWLYRIMAPANRPSVSLWLIAVQFVSAMISGVGSITAAGRVGKQSQDVELNPLLHPYSVYITGVGGVLAIILFVILVIKFVLIRDKRRKESAKNQGHQDLTLDSNPPRYSTATQARYIHDVNVLHQHPHNINQRQTIPYYG